MAIDRSAALGSITQLLTGGSYPNVKLGIGPYPVLSLSLRGGIEPGGSGVDISDKVPAVDQAAAWTFVQYLDKHAEPSHLDGPGRGTSRSASRRPRPRPSSISGPSTPGYKVASTQLVNGVTDPASPGPASSGSVIGPYPDVRTDILTAEETMFVASTSPATALSSAQTAANTTLSQYNQRLG
jgi:ABC-type glycerol-3-phosphate transport system substrate-binding protein